MTVDSQQYQQLQHDRQTIVQQLIELNSKHIRSQGQLAGIEIHLSRCHESIERGTASEDTLLEINRYEQELVDVEATRTAIDAERDRLNEILQKLDDAFLSETDIG